MRSPTSLRTALIGLGLAALALSCQSDTQEATGDPPCASGPVAPSADVVVPSAAPLPAAPRPGSSATATAAPRPGDVDERALRFTAGAVEAADLEALGIELAPRAHAAEVAEHLTPFAERIGHAAVARCRDGDRGACARLLALYATGALTPADPRAAATLRADLVGVWTDACRAGDDGACVALLDLPAAVGVPGRAAIGRRACARHRGLGCEILAAAAEAPATRDTLRVEAAGLYVDACDDGDVRACERLAGMYRRGEVKNPMRPRARRVGLLEHARALWRARCDAGDPLACAELGVSWLSGPKADAYAARAAFARAVPPVRVPAP